MSHPVASDALRRVSVAADKPSLGVVFRLHQVVRRDVLTASAVGSVLCLGTALYSLHSSPQVPGPLSLGFILVAEVAGLSTATVCAMWALGLAVRVDAEGIHRFNLLFPEWVKHVRWDELGGVVPRSWWLSLRTGYPEERLVLVPLRGAKQLLPPLDDQRTLIELARRHIKNQPLTSEAE